MLVLKFFASLIEPLPVAHGERIQVGKGRSCYQLRLLDIAAHVLAEMPFKCILNIEHNHIMPARRKPTSTRQKKADQQLKRAIKRGDVPLPDPKKKPHHRKSEIGQTGNSDNAALVESARKLQSSFIKLPPKYLEETKLLASTSPLFRPIPIEKTTFKFFHIEDDPLTAVLTCPKRPKWKFEMSKLEVERNEEGVYKKWLAQTDQLLEEWQNREEQNSGDITTAIAQLRSPSYFERNLEVWRQLYVFGETFTRQFFL